MLYHERTTQDYKIQETTSCKQVSNVAASFLYKGYTISMSTHNYHSGGCLNTVVIFTKNGGYLKDDCYSVQEAIEYINSVVKD